MARKGMMGGDTYDDRSREKDVVTGKVGRSGDRYRPEIGGDEVGRGQGSGKFNVHGSARPARINEKLMKDEKGL